MFRSTLIGILFAFFYGEDALAQNTLPHDIELQINERILEGHHQGLIIGYLDQSGTKYYGFGKVSPTSGAVPTENSVFEIGSLTKGFTALLIADLGLDINENLDVYVPELKGISEQIGKPITMESLLTHTAGLRRDPTNVTRNDANRYSDYSVADLEEFLRGYTDGEFKPQYSYSNVGFAVLEHAIEKKTGATYEALLADHVFQELGMTNTYINVPISAQERMVTGFNRGRTPDAIDTGLFPAMGGVLSTARDMLAYLNVHIGLEPSRLNSAAIQTHQQIYQDEKYTLSSGWRIMKRPETEQTIYHFSGGTNGFRSFVAFDRDNQKAVVVLVSGSGWFSDLGFKLLDPTYPLNDPDPVDPPSFWERFLEWLAS